MFIIGLSCDSCDIMVSYKFKRFVSSNLFSFKKKMKLKIKNITAFTFRYKFENRSNNHENLCIILAGYKEFTWDIVFDRINKFSNEDIDICIVSSGLYSEDLSNIAKMYNWSYVSTKRNCVTLAQNVAIKLFPNAKFIYKIDEDIFVTKNFFNTLKDTYSFVQEKGEFNVGFVAPLIPINGYGHVVLLKKLGLIDYYNNHFELVKYAAGADRMIENNLEVAKFMWGDKNIVPHIDDLDKCLNDSEFSYFASPIRFSIGAVYFSRELWENMFYFKVGLTKGMGLDEVQLCSYCMVESKAMVISENTCVGHLSFGSQNEGMEKYFKSNKDKFYIK